MIKIVCSEKKGFRRGGVLHTRGDNLYPEDYFTEEQIKQLLSEPKLVVRDMLKPTAPGLMSEKELYEALKDFKAEFSKTEPRVLLVEKLKKAIDLAGSAPAQGGEYAAFEFSGLIEAGKQAIADGATIASGAPDLKAMEAIYGKDVTAADRDRVWDAIVADNESSKG